MAIEKKQVDYAKECSDVMDLVVAVVKHFKEGKKVSEAALLLDELMAAMSGMDQIDDELKANQEAVFNSVLLGASELVALLLKKKDEAAA